MNLRWLKILQNVKRTPEVVNAVSRLEEWQHVLRAYLQFGAVPYPLTFSTRSGITIEIDNFDELVTAWVVFCRDEYIVPTNAELILDVGANYGAFLLLAASAAPQAQIFSLEPFPATFTKLQKNNERNQFSNRIHPYKLALAAVSGSAKMDLSPELGSHLRALAPDSSQSPQTEVPAISLNDLIASVLNESGRERIDLFKMDIEGGEHSALMTVQPELLNRIARWQMEYHPNGPRKSLFARLEEAGLRCVKDIKLGEDYGVAHFTTH